ncbi:hypothetical protein [Asanoa sp. NPDC050611]|uniref:DUF6928 family protein n=1 Tax=Asanoa sp. NPDC050611 TaxID=3157098 RepID=UPI0033DE6988
MGTKTALLVFGGGELRDGPAAFPVPDRAEMAALARAVHPGYGVEDAGERSLGDSLYPDDGLLFATRIGTTVILADRRFQRLSPTELPEHLREIAGDRRVVLHAMHSVVDAFSFAVWEQGRLVRAVSLSHGDGIVEDIGEPFPFERPYRDPLPFHPLELGEAALADLFPFDLLDVPMCGFRLVDPSGEEQARRAALEALVSRMGSPKRYRLVDGELRPV